MKKFLENKFLFMFLMAFLILIAINTSCFAVTGTSMSGNEIDFPDFSEFLDDYYTDFVVFKDFEGIYRLAIFNPDDCTVEYLVGNVDELGTSSNFWLMISGHGSKDNRFIIKYYSLYEGEFYRDDNQSYASCSRIDDNLFYSSFDIVDVNNNVVFQKARPKTGKLAQIVTPQMMNNPLQEILGILPIVMIVIVGFLALRKALAQLFRLLRQS